MASFYPRARGGRDFGQFLTSRHPNVSIHAPAGGATATSARVCRAYCVSIHAPAGGATSGRSYSQPAGTMVSIHAPAGGATSSARTTATSTCFYPRARGGRDCTLGSISFSARPFLSTRPRGARLCSGKPYHRPGTFLSTRPRGARQLYPKRLEITKL